MPNEGQVPPSRMLIVPRLFDGETMRGPHAIRIADGRIADLSPLDDADGLADALVLPPETVLAPGFIDLQVNGGGGVLLNDAPNAAAVRRIASAHRRFGTTGLLPTLITDEPAKMIALAREAVEALAVPGILGFHLEGPFINPARQGIHPPQLIRPPTADDIALLRRFGGFGRSIVTLAPECVPAGTIEALTSAGLRVCIGHSAATAAEVAAATQAGAAGVTHLFNAMSQVTPREPGVVGAALASGDLHAGIICDGLHVDPLNLKLACRALGLERLMLVTDAMPLVGTDQTEFTLQGRRIRLWDGRLSDEGGTLAGAHLTMIDAVRNAVSFMGIRLEEALRMASLTPAEFLGLDGSLGRIAPGYRADLVAFSDAAVTTTWIGGEAG